MASPYSQPTQFTPYQELVDKNLLSKALAYRQEKYDFNRAKVQEAIQKISSLDFAKSQDEEYFYNRLQNIENAINQYGAGDLSLDSRSDYLTGFIGQSVDDRVMNGYMGTLAGRNINSGAQASMEEGLYDERNHAYSLQDYNKWVSDGQTGSQFKGNSNYIEYTDFDAMIRENVLDKIDPEGFFQFDPMGNYTYLSTEGEAITPDRIKSQVSLYIANNPNIQRQLRINSWAQFQGMDDETFFAQTQDNVTQPYDNLISQISTAKYDLAVSTDPEKSAKLAEEIQVLEAGLKNYNNSLSNKNRASLEYQLYTNDLLNGYADAYQEMSITGMGFETNQGALQMAMHNDKMSFEREKLASQQAQDFYDRAQEGYIAVINAYNSGEPGAALQAEQLFDAYSQSLSYMDGPLGMVNPITAVYGITDFADFVNKQDSGDLVMSEITDISELSIDGYAATMEEAMNTFNTNNKQLEQLYTSVWGSTTVEGGGTVMDLFKYTAKEAAELGKPELEGTMNYSALANDFAKEDGLFSAEVLAKYGKQLPTSNEMSTGESFGQFKLRFDTEFADVNELYKVDKEVMKNIETSVEAWFGAADALTEGNAFQEAFRRNPTIELAGGTLTKNPGEDFYRFDLDVGLMGNMDLTDFQANLLLDNSNGEVLRLTDYKLSEQEAKWLVGEELFRKEGRLDMFLPSRAGEKITTPSGRVVTQDQIETIDLSTIRADMNAVFQKRFGGVFKTADYTVSLGSPASRNQAAYILKIANAQGLDLGDMAPFQDGEVIRTAMEATQKLDEEGGKSMGDLGIRGMRYGLAPGGNSVYVKAEVFDADDGKFEEQTVVIPRSTIPVGTSLYEELNDDYEASKRLRQNKAFESSMFENMPQNATTDKTFSSYDYGPGTLKDERGRTVEYTNVNLQTGARFVKSGGGNSVGPVIIMTGTMADGSTTSFSYNQYVNRATTLNGTLEILNNSLGPMIDPYSPSYNQLAAEEIMGSRNMVPMEN